MYENPGLQTKPYVNSARLLTRSDKMASQSCKSLFGNQIISYPDPSGAWPSSRELWKQYQEFPNLWPHFSGIPTNPITQPRISAQLPQSTCHEHHPCLLSLILSTARPLSPFLPHTAQRQGRTFCDQSINKGLVTKPQQALNTML